ncbi:hypothetical protein BH20BAC1_BH20BAC1_01250 [soil metagenome]
MAYVTVTNKLRPVVKSIVYGKPCSTAPIYKTIKLEPAFFPEEKDHVNGYEKHHTDSNTKSIIIV